MLLAAKGMPTDLVQHLVAGWIGQTERKASVMIKFLSRKAGAAKNRKKEPKKRNESEEKDAKCLSGQGESKEYPGGSAPQSAGRATMTMDKSWNWKKLWGRHLQRQESW